MDSEEFDEAMRQLYEQFEIPNIEGLTGDPIELEVLAGSLRTLYELVLNKSEAVCWRLAGNINRARKFEDMVDMLFDELPKPWRW